MRIILLERVEKLGTIGDVVNVKNGFARNYLLPNNKALRANEANRKLFERNRVRLEEENDKRRERAKEQSGSVDGKQIVLIRQASNTGQLYGSVSVRDIVEALIEEGAHHVNKSMIELERPIKTLGVFTVKVTLHPEVTVTIGINVARSPEEAELQKQGINVSTARFEEDQEAARTALQTDNEDTPGDEAGNETRSNTKTTEGLAEESSVTTMDKK